VVVDVLLCRSWCCPTWCRCLQIGKSFAPWLLFVLCTLTGVLTALFAQGQVIHGRQTCGQVSGNER
jgi:hypothetical protein